MAILDESRYKIRKPDEKKILDETYQHIAQGADWCAPIHKRIYDNEDFVRGDQWLRGDAEKQEARERPHLALNSLLKLVNAVANKEMMDRIVPGVFGRSEEDNGVAEAMDECVRWSRDISETEHEESMAFRTVATSGYGVMHKWWNPIEQDGLGMIEDESVPVGWMLWDPTARKQNLVDRWWHMCGKYVPLDNVAEEYGTISKKNKTFFNMVKRNSLEGMKPLPTNLTRLAHVGTWGEVVRRNWFSRSKQEVFVIEHEWAEIKMVYKIAMPVNLDIASQFYSDPSVQYQLGQDPQTGEPITMDYQKFNSMREEDKHSFMETLLDDTRIEIIDDKKDLEAILADLELMLGREYEDWTRKPKKVYKYAIVCHDRVLEAGDRPMGFTYEFMTGFPFFSQNGMDWFGMVDVGKGAQDMKNVFFSNMLTIYMTSPKQHLLVEEGAVADTDTFANEYAKVSGLSFVPDGFLTSGRFMQMQAPEFPPMLKELLQICDSAVQDLFGLSSIEIGAQGDLRRVSGNTANMARQASNTILANLFDALRRYRRRWGLLSIKFIKEFYSDPQEIARIVGPEVSQYIGDLKEWPDHLIFDIKIDEAPSSISEQMELIDYLTRTGVLEQWRAAGEITFDDVLDLMVTIPQSKRDRIKRSREQRQVEQQQMQQLQQQLDDANEREVMWQNFMAITPQGQMIQKEFENLMIIHNQIMEQRQQQEQQQQQ